MNRVRLLRYGSGALILLLVFIFQATVMRAMDIRGIVPNLYVVTIVAFGLLRGRLEGALAGVVIGLLQDMFYGNVIGFYAAIYMYIGYFTGYLHRNFYKDSVLIPVGIMSGADLLVNLTVYFFTFLFRGQLAFHRYMGQIIIPELIYTLFVGFVMYRLLFMINRFIEQVEWSKEYESD